MREYQVRICERLGVKFPGPTRQEQTLGNFVSSGLEHSEWKILASTFHQ